MIRILLTAAIFCLTVLAGASEHDEFSALLDENSGMDALSEYKDDDVTLKVKYQQLKNINRYRKKYSVSELKLDIFAGRVANMQSRNAAEKGYSGHWDTSGNNPYLRYGLAGGNDHVAENAAAINGEGVKKGFCTEGGSKKILSEMKELLDAFMNEGPGGGHHDTVVDAAHTHVGLGYACVQNGDEYRVRYYEEYIDRYFEFDKMKKTAKPGEEVTVTGRSLDKDTGPYALVVFYEPVPAKMSPSQITAQGGYRDFSKTMHKQMPAWDIQFDPKIRKFSVSFKVDKKGYYYVQLFARKGIASIPYKKAKGAKIKMKGVPVGSGIIIRVS